MVLLSRNGFGSAMLLSTCVSAAKLMKASQSSMMSLRAYGFDISALMKCYLSSFSRSLRFSGFDPTPILSMLMILLLEYFERVYRMKLLPMKPKPPVTKIFIIEPLLGLLRLCYSKFVKEFFNDFLNVAKCC